MHLSITPEHDINYQFYIMLTLLVKPLHLCTLKIFKFC